MSGGFDFFNAYALSEDKVVSGAPVVHAPSGIKFYIARGTNRPYTSAVRRLYQKYEKELAAAEDPNATQEAREAAQDLGDKLLVEIRADHLLKGWDGEVPYNGEKLAYSRDNAIKLLKLENFLNWVLEESANMENFKAIRDKEEEKN